MLTFKLDFQDWKTVKMRIPRKWIKEWNNYYFGYKISIKKKAEKVIKFY